MGHVDVISDVVAFVLFSLLSLQSPAQYSQIEQEALKVAQEMSAEYWAVSSLTG